MSATESAPHPRSPLAILHDYSVRGGAPRVGERTAPAADAAWSGMVCQLGDERAIVPVAEVAEVIDMPRVTRVPGTASWYLGLGSLRGRVLPLNDLRGYLHGHPSAASSLRRVLVHGTDTDGVGFVVDDLLGLHAVSAPPGATCDYQGQTLAVLSLAEIATQPRFQRVDLESI
ncbi:MAG: chemotaxis protein CheW [Pseudomonadota bacterium]